MCRSLLSNFLNSRFRIATGDNLYRQVIFPEGFGKQDKKWLLKPELLWNITANRPTHPDTFETSLVWQRLAPTSRHVRGYGCRVALERDRAQQKRGVLDAEHHIYCGAYQILVDDIRALAGFEMTGIGKIASADVLHQIEANGEIAHAALIVKLDQPAPNAKSATIGIFDRLWRLSAGPIKQACHCDRYYSPHPNVLLGAGPRGGFVDSRPLSVYWTHFFRFQFDRLLLGAARIFG